MNKRINIGINSFTASLHKIDECELNGLPRLPNSVNIIGRFEELKYINHKNLCTYIDAKRDKNEKIIMVTEYFICNWEKKLPSLDEFEHFTLINYIADLCSALLYLHKKGVIVRNLSPKNIYWTENNDIKLANYGMYYMTNNGKEVDFPIGDLKYMAPEGILELYDNQNMLSSTKSDVWSLGVIVLEIIKNQILDIKPENLVACLSQNMNKFESIFLDNLTDINTDDTLIKIVKLSIKSNIQTRASINEIFELCNKSEFTDNLDFKININKIENYSENLIETCDELYHFWTLTGGNLWKCLSESGETNDKTPPVLSLPLLILKNGDVGWPNEIKNRIKCYSNNISILNISKLSEILIKKDISIHDIRLKLPLEYNPLDLNDIDFIRTETHDELQTRKLPLSVKERDLKYQLKRVAIFRRLLRGYPLTIKWIIRESSYDIPPFLRSKIWPILLNVNQDSSIKRYKSAVLGPLTNRASAQIAVDLPRCHSYDEVTVSPTGQRKLDRVIRAWLVAQPQLEYTQGMDSLAAVFTRLLIGNEAVAFACLEAFVDKYMRGLFCSGHGGALNEYCQVLQHLLVFHRPILGTAINMFSITGFTASWIYTGFAHSLPLEKTVSLWDAVILGESSFLMMVFIALLIQLDKESSFSKQSPEDIFSVLSNLPEFDLDLCRRDAIELAYRTPSSFTIRNFATNEQHSNITTLSTVSIISPKLSLDDLLLLIGESFDTKKCQQNPLSSPPPFSFNPRKLPPPILIDIRSREIYSKGCLPGSINMPVKSESDVEKLLLDDEYNDSSTSTSNESSCVKVIIDSHGDEKLTQLVAKIFVHKFHYQYVCILNGGIQYVRNHRPDLLVIVS